jgi:hypothetical protein
MKPMLRPVFATLLHLLVAASKLMAAQRDDNSNSITSVPRWQPQDFAFTNAVAVDNPFKVQFTAEVSGPNGTKMVLPGFFRSWHLENPCLAHGGGRVVPRYARVFACSRCPASALFVRA